MSRRTAAGLLALGLAVVLLVFAALQPVPYVTYKPGPTVNVLGDYNGEKVIQIKGHPVYDDGGALRMLTVYQSGPEQHLDLLTVFAGWVSPDVALIPRGRVYGKKDTVTSVHQESAEQMTSSQDDATIAGLRAAGISVGTEVVVRLVAEDGASAGILKPQDVILKVNGKAITTTDGLIAAVTALKPGSTAAVTIRRATTAADGEEPATEVKTVTVKTRADPEDPKKARINITPGTGPVFPFEVRISLGDGIGGPSAGMMFALTIYDLLTPGSLTGGKSVAGTGTIDADGVVGEIGGIGQKMVGAQRDGARLFLVPAENWAEAIGSSYDKDKMKLACVHTIKDALTAINTWRENPGAQLAGCPS